MIVIKDKFGKIVSRSKNLAGVRRRLSGKIWSIVGVIRVRIWRYNDGRGYIFILFANGDRFSTEFGDFGVMCGWLRCWRNIYGTPLIVGGYDIKGHTGNQGIIEYANPFLKEFSA